MRLKEIKDMIGGISNTFKEKSEELSTIKQMIGFKEDTHSALLHSTF